MILMLTEADLRRLSHNLNNIAAAIKTALPHLDLDEDGAKATAIRMIAECHKRLAAEIEVLRLLPTLASSPRRDHAPTDH